MLARRAPRALGTRFGGKAARGPTGQRSLGLPATWGWGRAGWREFGAALGLGREDWEWRRGDLEAAEGLSNGWDLSAGVKYAEVAGKARHKGEIY